MTYSKELIEEITLYFKEKHNHIIDEETANEYLDSLAGLYLTFHDILNDKKKKIK